MATALQSALRGAYRPGGAPTRANQGPATFRQAGRQMAARGFSQDQQSMAGAPPPPTLGGTGAPPPAAGGGGGGYPAYGGGSSATGNPIYDALVNYAMQMHPGGALPWAGKEDALLGQIAAAVQMWGQDKVLGSLTGSWPAKAYQVALAGLGLGPAVYDRTGDGSSANLLYVPGYRPQGPESISGTRNENPGSPYGRFDSASRYLGHGSGLIDGRYVY